MKRLVIGASIVDERSNTLIVEATPDVTKEVRKLLEAMGEELH